MSLKDYPLDFIKQVVQIIREQGPIRRKELTQIVSQAAEDGEPWMPFESSQAEDRVVNALTDLCVEAVITVDGRGYYVQERA